ncbi:MAG: HAD family phosphatase, partial [Clostridiales bacterium]|nr:HAD family phosphatase [Clostridiales bacterium]
MKYKLFISDFDGTLGHSPENTIDQETLTAIKEYFSKGGTFVICSGRNLDSLTNILSSVNMQNTGVLVGIQGSIMKDLQTGELLFCDGLDKKTAIDFTNRLLADGHSVVLFLGDVMHFEQRDERIAYYVKMHGNISHKGNYVDSLEKEIEKSQFPVTKVLGICDKGLEDFFQAKYNEIYKGQNISVNSGGPYLLEGINPNLDKGNAVRFLAKHYNIPLDQVITVGDSTNDIPLVKGEWHGVAVGDGKQALKDVAKEVTVQS